MSEIALIETDSFEVESCLLGERLDLRALAREDLIDTLPCTLKLRDGGVVVLYRYGAAVFFNTSPECKAELIETLTPFVQTPMETPLSEKMGVRIQEGLRHETVSGSTMTLPEATPKRLQVIADVLAKSIVLDAYEARIAAHFVRIEPIALRLEEGHYGGMRAKEALKHIGSALISEHQMVGRVEISEKPEVLWESPELERLYARLSDEFEIEDRYTALERKLGLISRTAETLLELIQAKHSYRLEWYIIILIGVEIVISLYELFIKLY
tara:strand:- start:13109 stop:13915 length:807 start_codon:yes stop_codon:yes gene_type:complete